MQQPDTFSILTSPGPAAIAVIELRGPGAAAWRERHVRFSRAGALAEGEFRRASLADADGQPVDDILVSLHARPEDPHAHATRLHLHGSPGLVRLCSDWLLQGGFRQLAARPSDLWTASDPFEAAAFDVLPRIATRRGLEWVFANLARLKQRAGVQASGAPRVVDWFTTPLRVALVGPPNAGKSTLANALADQQVSIVSATPGTTRDWVEIPAELDGFPVVWLDTPGLRHDPEALEAQAIEQARGPIASADARLLVLDVTDARGAAAYDAFSRALRVDGVVLNKCDHPAADAQRVHAALPADLPMALLSAAERRGLDELAACLWRAAGRDLSWLERATDF